jgi:hypothetical protein
MQHCIQRPDSLLDHLDSGQPHLQMTDPEGLRDPEQVEEGREDPWSEMDDVIRSGRSSIEDAEAGKPRYALQRKLKPSVLVSVSNKQRLPS